MEAFDTRANVTCLDISGGWSLSIYSKTETTKSPIRRPSLKINAISNWIALAANIMVGFLLTPYLIEHLGMERYGIWALIISIIGYYGLLELGVSSAIMRYVARYVGQRDYNSLNRTTNTAIAILSFIGSVIIVVSILVENKLAGFFHIEPQNYESFKITVILLSITTCIMLPGNVLRVVILAHERFVVCNIINIIHSILKAGLFCLVLYNGGGLVHLSMVFCALSLFVLFINFAVIRHCFKYMSFSIGLISRSTARDLISFGFFSFVAQIGILLSTKLDAAIVGRFISMHVVGVYNVAALMYGYLLNLIISLSGVLQPRLAALAGTATKTEFNGYIIRYSIIVANYAVAMGVTAFCLSEDFLKLWLPRSFQDTNLATITFQLLLIALMAGIMQDVSANALRAVKKHKYYAYQTIIEGIAHVTLSIFLVRRFGIIGVAIGAVIPAVIAKIMIQPIYFCKIFLIDWWEYMLKVILKPLLVGSVICFFLTSNAVFFAATCYLGLILKGIVVLSLYLAISFFFCLDSTHRREIVARFGKVHLTIRNLIERRDGI